MNTKAAAAPSPGLALLIAATYAFPKSLGDRARSAAMNSILDIAVANRVRFDVNDGSAIQDAGLDMRTCVGVFRPLDQHWYEKAANSGNAYAMGNLSRLYDQGLGTPIDAAEAVHHRLQFGRIVVDLRLVHERDAGPVQRLLAFGGELLGEHRQPRRNLLAGRVLDSSSPFL